MWISCSWLGLVAGKIYNRRVERIFWLIMRLKQDTMSIIKGTFWAFIMVIIGIGDDDGSGKFSG